MIEEDRIFPPTISPKVYESLREKYTQFRIALDALYLEIDCRIEHGAESGGHLPYIRTRLKDILSSYEEKENNL
jgi:hypothetical protein